VEVHRTLDRALVAFQDPWEIGQVLAVATNLEDGLRERASSHAVHRHQLVVAFPALGGAHCFSSTKT
jgi:hypothetical protein